MKKQLSIILLLLFSAINLYAAEIYGEKWYYGTGYYSGFQSREYNYLLISYKENKPNYSNVYSCSEGSTPEWKGLEDVEAIIIDESMKNAPLTSTAHWFEDMKNVQLIINAEYLNTSDVTDMSFMFSNMKSLKYVNLSNFVIRPDAKTDLMFYGCTNLQYLEISKTFENSSDMALYGVGSSTEPCYLAINDDYDIENASDENNFTYKGGRFLLPKNEYYCIDPSNWDGYPGICYAFFDNKKKFHQILFGFSVDGIITKYELGDKYDPIYCYISIYPYYPEDTNPWPYQIYDYDSESHDSDGVTIVLDESIKNYRPTSTKNWFFFDYDSYDPKPRVDIIGLNYLNTSCVTDMNSMFRGCYFLPSLDVSFFDTSKVTDMSYMFAGLTNVSNLDLRNFDTSNVTNMEGMFGCSFWNPGYNGFKSLDLSSFNTSQVTNMSSMFSHCGNLISLDLSNFDTSNVTNMERMFCLGDEDFEFGKEPDLQSINVSSFNTSKVTDMSHMFAYCKNLASLDLSNFTIGNSTKTDEMIVDCSGLKELHLSSSMSNLAENACTGVGTPSDPCILVVPGDFDFGDIDVTSTFVWKSGYFKLANYPIISLSADKKTLTFKNNENESSLDDNLVFNLRMDENNKPGWYNYNSSITKVVFDPSFRNIHPSTTASWFNGMSNLTEIEGIENLNTSDVTSMSYMFSGCSSLKSIDLSHFDTSNVTLMGYMFLNCNSLESLDVSNFDTSASTSFYRMFQGCKSLASLDLSNFDISENASTSYMLNGCSGLKELNVSSSMASLKENACTNVGTTSEPCYLFAPKGFNFGADTSGNYFQWKKGYFKLGVIPEMSAASISIGQGAVADLPINITNGDVVLNGYQFDLVLPDGFSLAKDNEGDFKYKLSNRYTGKISVAISQVNANTYRIIAFSIQSVQITGKEGVVITLTVKSDDDIETGAYEGKLTEINLSRADGFGLYPDDVTFGITVKSARPGDVNHDGKVNVSDVMAVVNHILGSTPSVFFEEEADMNNDTKINVTDVMNIVNIILNEPSGAPLNYRLNTADDIYLRSDGRAYDICLHATEPYTACEMTVQLPDGCELLDAALANSIGNSHKLLTNRMDEDTYRFVIYAPQGEQLHLSNDALVRLSISGNVNSAVKISDILFTNGIFENIILENVEYMPTGIEEITSVPSEAPTYNIQGMKTRSTKKGVYIQNGRKIVVK